MGTLKLEDLPHYTYEEYQQWEGHWELINGIPYAMSPSPTFEHQKISGKIHIELTTQLKNCPHCKPSIAVDWILANDTVVCPDNAVICTDRITDFIQTPPTLIFEILSPSTQKKDRTVKYHLFQEAGVKYYVLVDPKEKFAEIYQLKQGRYHLTGKFSHQPYIFELEHCQINFIFQNIF